MTTKKISSKPQIHVSMLDTLSMCGVFFRRRYGARFGIWHEEETTPLSMPLIIGITAHKIAELNLRSIMDSGKMITRESIPDLTRDEFARKCEGEIHFTEEEAENPRLTIDTNKDLTINLNLLHYDQVAPKIKPVAIEEAWVIEMDGYDFDLAGKFDLITKGEFLRDLKTAGKRPANGAKTLQMAMYSQAYKILHSHFPRAVALDVLLKNKTPVYAEFSATPDESWVPPLFRRIENFAQIIKAEQAGFRTLTPCDPNHWKCSKKYCGFAETCEFWSGR